MDINKLEKLCELKEEEIITQEQFDAEKKKILQSGQDKQPIIDSSLLKNLGAIILLFTVIYNLAFIISSLINGE